MAAKYYYSRPSQTSFKLDIYYDKETEQVTQVERAKGRDAFLPIIEEGSVLDIYCNGTTQVTLRATDYEPYAYIQKELNSTSCGYVQDPDPVQSDPDKLSIDSLAVSGETRYQKKDGRVEAVVTVAALPYYSSIDNINYLRNTRIYENLSPGSYIFYLTDNNGNLSQQQFTINEAVANYGCTNNTALNYDPSADLDNGSCVFYVPTPGLPPEPLPPDDPTITLPDDQRLNLYQDPDIFRLGIGDDWYIIDMPIGWQNVEFHIMRDEVYHGLNYEYNDGEIELGFDLAAGFELLEAAYLADGNDAQVRFQFGRDLSGLFLPDVDAWVDFNTRKIDRDKITCSVKRKTFNDDIENKSEVIVSLTDGYLPLPLHSKLIRKQSLLNTGVQTGTDTVLPAERVSAYTVNYEFRQFVYGFIDFTKATAGDLSKSAPSFGVQTTWPVTNKQYVFKTDGGGPFNFAIDLRVRMGTHMNQPSIAFETPRQRRWNYDWYLIIVSGGVNTFYTFDGGVGGEINNSRNNDITVTFKLNKSLTLLQDDEVYIYGQYSFGASGSYNSVNAQQDFVYVNLAITGDTLAKPTITSTKLAYEVGQGILDDITGGQAKLRSNLLGRTDIGYAQDGCASLMAYLGGYLIRGFTYDKRPIQITFKDWIAGLNAVYAIGLSYELNADGTYGVRLEQQDYFYADVLVTVFSGVSEYNEVTDVKRIYNELDFGYDKFPTDDVSTLDEFNTRHTYLTPIQSLKAKFTQISPQCASGDAIELTRRVQFSTTSQDSYKYDEVNFIVALLRDGNGYKPEKAENYVLSGVVGPDTVYNLRYTISRNIDRWGRWLNSAWAYKKPSAVIQNKYVAKNGDLTSQYVGSSPCETNRQFTEANDIYVNDLKDADKLFYPENITFKVRLSWQTLSLLRRCYSGNDSSGKNYGYIGVQDPNGDTQYGYLKSLTYSPATELGTFVLYKKYIPLGTPFDCTDYSNYTFAEFESATGLPIEIEQCRFNNFA